MLASVRSRLEDTRFRWAARKATSLAAQSSKKARALRSSSLAQKAACAGLPGLRCQARCAAIITCRMRSSRATAFLNPATSSGGTRCLPILLRSLIVCALRALAASDGFEAPVGLASGRPPGVRILLGTLRRRIPYSCPRCYLSLWGGVKGGVKEVGNGIPRCTSSGAPFHPIRFFCCFSVGVDLGGFLDIGSQGGLFSSEWKEAVFGTREVRWGLNTFHDAKRLLLVSGQE